MTQDIPQHPDPVDTAGTAPTWRPDFLSLLAGQGCGMCATPDEDDIGWGLRFFRDAYLDAYLWRSGRVRGYTVARWKGARHVVDPTDLEPEEAAGFWRELLHVGAALKAHYQPLKLNIKLLGNVLPHLHAHVFPRMADDPAAGGPMPWAYLEEGRQDEEQLAADTAALRRLAHPTAPSNAGVTGSGGAAVADTGPDRRATLRQQTPQPGHLVPLVHKWRIDPRESQRHEQRRGRRHGYTSLDSTRTALLVIDAVPFFDGPYLRGIIPQVNQIATALRTAGGTVAWVLPGPGKHRPAREEFYGSEVAEMFRTSGGTGAPATRLLPGLALDEERDLLLEKAGTSALFPGSGDLHQELQQRGIATVVLCGTVTGVCVESTARDAAELDYRVILVADACAGGSDDAHNASLRVVYRSFGDVRPTAEVLGLIRSGSSRS